MTTKERLHQLIEELPEEDLPTVERVLSALRDTAGDPVLRMLAAAPMDDEPLTDEARAAIAESREQYRRGEYRILERPSRAKPGH